MRKFTFRKACFVHMTAYFVSFVFVEYLPVYFILTLIC